MDLEIIIVDRIDIGIYTLEKQTESTIDIYDVVVKIIECIKK
jgi:hypothetical protein